jgi:hypothetical protein
MTGLVPGIHAVVQSSKKDVDGRDKPGHDDGQFEACSPAFLCAISCVRAANHLPMG